MIPKKIELLSQQGQATCGQTCVAMVMGTSEDYVCQIVGDGPTSGQHIVHALAHFKVGALSNQQELLWGSVYIATVPSLRHVGRMHYIVVDCREEGDPVFLDPSGAYDEATFDEFGCVSLIRIVEGLERTVTKDPDEWVKAGTRVAIIGLAHSLNDIDGEDDYEVKGAADASQS